MAESSTQRENSFTCSVCLDLMKDPVAVPCGHTYCLGCIKGCWDQEDGKGIYSCPQCRQTFRPRPVLGRNILIAEMVEEFRKTRIQTDVPVSCPAGPGDVECDLCTGRKLKAVKSCLDCLLSYYQLFSLLPSGTCLCKQQDLKTVSQACHTHVVAKLDLHMTN